MIRKRSSWRFLLTHPLQLFLSILGITLGVAVYVGIDLASNSARKAFQLSSKLLIGSATDEILGGAQGVDETLYQQLKVDLGLPLAAPMLRSYVSATAHPQRSLHLVGMDPFAEAAFRDYSALLSNTNNKTQTLSALLRKKNAILLNEQLLSRWHLQVGDHLLLRSGTREIACPIVGSFAGRPAYQEALTHLVLTDLSSAQEILQRQGFLSSIELILPAEQSAAWRAKITALLPPDHSLVTAGSQQKAAGRLSQAFETNLETMSLLALMVGLFLIYNSTMFTVLQRRDLFGRLRAIGVQRSEIFRQIISESLVLGILGSVAGFLLGWGLAQGLLVLITRTINDLYYVLEVTQLALEFSHFATALLLGLGATLLAATLPALEAANSRPAIALSRAHLESGVRTFVFWSGLCGALGLLLSGLISMLAPQSLAGGFLAILLVTLSYALLVPSLVVGLVRLMAWLCPARWGLVIRMAIRNIDHSLSRSAIAIAALCIAVATTLAMDIMIGSFRSTVDYWLSDYLHADIFISPIGGNSGPSNSLPASLIDTYRQLPEISAVSSVRRLKLFSTQGTTQLMVMDLPASSFSALRLKEGDPAQAAQAYFHQKGILLSEPYAVRHRLQVGDTLTLPTDQGKHPFLVVGIYFDYGSEQGIVNMSRQTFKHYWRDTTINTLGLYLHPGHTAEALLVKLHTLAGKQQLDIAPQAAVHNASMKIFDQTFKVTRSLNLLVALVAFVGVLSALLAIQLERTREMAILRAIGLTPGQLRQAIGIETLLMGALAGILAFPLGSLMAWMLIHIINYRSFGWSILSLYPLTPYLQALWLALLAAGCAALYPIYKIKKITPALAMKGIE